ILRAPRRERPGHPRERLSPCAPRRGRGPPTRRGPSRLSPIRPGPCEPGTRAGDQPEAATLRRIFPDTPARASASRADYGRAPRGPRAIVRVMPAPALVVTEIFRSLQGESSFAGLPCTFVRLTGCALRCVWCDSAYAF